MLSTSFSQLLGYSSIACWLGAQFPQLVENIKRQSCAGLALPFLANWFLGDVSNLIGCILTNQLPFQTYLAMYFVFVDLTLVSQYFYYYSRPIPLLRTRPLSSVSRTRTSVDRVRYRTLSVVAANVAASAALAAQQDEHVHVDHRRHWPPDDVDVDENALGALADSFHSEAGPETRRERISWSIERYRQRSRSLGGGAFSVRSDSDDILHDAAHRGRPLEREVHVGGGVALEVDPEVVSPSRLHSKARASTIMFLGVWALFGIAHQRQRGLATTTGVVLSARGDVNSPVDERAIGRTFAWLCTTLYLTSRLPQIWKNYVRKSVEGLSMYLFVFAFLGNAFYVASILTSPDLHTPESAAFLSESIPYLLGSGGTLMFDVVIVSQSFMYRPRARRHSALYSRLSEEERGLLGDEHGRGRTSSSDML